MMVTPKVRKWLLIGLIVPILSLFSKPAGISLLIYVIFVSAVLCKNPWWNFGARYSRWKTLILTAIIAGFLTETLAWLQNFNEGFKVYGAVFSTNYLNNFLIGIWYYIALGLAFGFIARFYKFTPISVFTTYGLFGIFLEQAGAVFMRAVAAFVVNPVQGILILLYTFMLHGAFAGLLFIPVKDKFNTPTKKWYQYPLAWICIYIAIIGGGILVELARKILSDYSQVLN